MIEVPMLSENSLDSIPLLASLHESERAELARRCSFRHFKSGEYIIDGDSDDHDVHFIVEGTVRVVNYSLSGREVALDDMGAGTYFGELAAIDNGPRSAFVVARGRGAISAAMPQPVFLKLLDEKPVVAREIMGRLARMLRQANDRIMDLSTLGANCRVVSELLRLAWHHTEDGRTAAIAPIPIHSDLASRVGTTRETVARALSDLARQGVIERGKKELLVHDMSRLAMVVEEMRGI